ncbi:MAG: acyl carrier protein [Clostridia bacterium]|nr:acyl carrier protein [Clostridia bacterium]
MDRQEILTALIEIVAGIKEKPIDDFRFVTEQTKIVEDLGLNSIGVLYVVLGIEDRFGVEMRDLKFENFLTVGSVLDYIEENA